MLGEKEITLLRSCHQRKIKICLRQFQTSHLNQLSLLSTRDPQLMIKTCFPLGLETQVDLVFQHSQKLRKKLTSQISTQVRASVYWGKEQILVQPQELQLEMQILGHLLVLQFHQVKRQLPELVNLIIC